MTAKEKRDAIFEKRLAEYGPELKWLYMELYDDEGAYDYFISMLKKNYDARKVALHKLDEARLQDTGWFKRQDILGMLLYVQAFGQDDGIEASFHGTLKGVQKHLDYLVETGVNYLHLMPIVGRYHMGEKLLAIFNFSREPQKVFLPEHEFFTDLLSQKELCPDTLTLPGCSFLWLLKDYRKNE